MLRCTRLLVLIALVLVSTLTFATTVTVSSDASPKNAGTVLTVTITLSGDAGGYTGIVRLYDGTKQLSAFTLNGSSSTVTFKTNQLGTGTHSLTASYAGDANNGAATSSAYSQSILGTTTTTLTATPNPSIVGANVALVGTVKTTSSGSPDGTLTYLDGVSTLGTATLGAASGSFTTSTATFSGYSYYGFQNFDIADMDGDGIPDIFAVSGPYYVFLKGDGAGNYTLTKNGTVGLFPNSCSTNGVRVADVNNDGKPDLILSCWYYNNVQIYLGNGDGTVASSPNSVLTSNLAYTGEVQVADLNGDGNPDLMIANTNGNNWMTIYLGNGDGTFTEKTTLGIAWPGSITVADMNGDGKPDIVAAAINQYYPGYMYVFYGVGDGTFTASPLALANNWEEVQSLAVGDINGDGHLDVVTTIGNGGVDIFYGDGAGNFSQTQYTKPNMQNVKLMDLNGDGLLDIVGFWDDTSVSGNRLMRVMYASSPGTYPNKTTDYAIPAQQNSMNTIRVADIDGGGRPDIVVYGGVDPSTHNSTFVKVNTYASASAELDSTFAVGTHPLTVSCCTGGSGSFSASTSGEVDLVILQAPTISLLSDTNPSNYGASVTLSSTVSGGFGTPTGSVSFYDGTSLLGTTVLDGSGNASLVTQNIAGGTRSVTAVYSGDSTYGTLTSAALVQMVNKGTPGFTIPTITVPSGYPVVLTISAQLTGYGSPSGTVTFYSDKTYGGNGRILLGTAPVISGTATIKTSGVPPGQHYIYANYSGDVNYNAASATNSTSALDAVKPSILFFSSLNPSNYTDYVQLTATVTATNDPGTNLNGTVTFQDGATTLATSGLSNVSAGWNIAGTVQAAYQVYAGDFNGDGYPDLFAVSGNQVLLDLNNGSGGFGSSILSYTSCAQTGVVGDFNGDGKLDIAWSDGCAAGNQVFVMLGNGDGTFQAVHKYDTGSSHSYYMTSGDVNGDGKIDLVVANGQDGTVSILLGNGDGTFAAPNIVSVGSSNAYTPTIFDFNNDGKADLLVPTYTNNTVQVLLGNGDGTFGTPTAFTATNYSGTYFNVQNVLVGDLNNDGKPDLVICASRSIYVALNNGDGTYTMVSYFFAGNYAKGLSSDLQSPQLIDVDGDGNLDLVNASFNFHTVNIQFGHGDGQWTNYDISASGSYNQGLAVGDFDGGGKLDFVTTAPYSFYGASSVLLWQMRGGAAYSSTSLSVGSHPVSASYADSAVSSGTANFSQVVNLDPTTTSLNVSSATPIIGHPFSATANVSSAYGTPTGSVTFFDGANSVATVAVDGSGNAVYSTSALAMGAHSFTATFGAGAQYDTSTSAASAVTVYDSVAHVISPANGATNVDASSPVNISWTSVANPQTYYLYVGTTVGASNVFTSNSLNTSAQVALNANTTYYLRLFTKQNNGWSYVDSSFTTGNLGKSAVITSPANGATNVDGSSPVTISWVGGMNVATYYLYVGTSQGTANVYGSGEVTVTSEQVKLQPSTVYYCRIFTKTTSNAWSYTDSSFTTGSQGSPAAITSPANGATNVDGSAPISVTWNTVPGAITYFLYVGTSVGASDVYASGETTGTSASLTRFINPSTTYYIRLFTKFSSGWKYRDTTFTTGSQQLMAYLTSPLNGVTNVANPSLTIHWSAATNAQAYFLYVGTSQGANDVFSYGETLNTQATVTTLSPSTFYWVRMWTRNAAGVWHYNDSVFTTGP